MSAVAPSPEPEEEPESTQNPHGNSSEEQGSVVPLGWKPTPSQPVPVVRCTQIKKDGERCKRWSIRGYHKCVRHAGPGARMPDGNVNKYAAAVIEAARLRLVEDTDMALDVIHDLAQPGSGEAIRLKAAESILDRAGIRGGIELDVNVEHTLDSPVDEIKRRIAELKRGSAAVEKMKHEAEEIVDAEIIEEDTPLFDLDEEQE